MINIDDILCDLIIECAEESGCNLTEEAAKNIADAVRCHIDLENNPYAACAAYVNDESKIKDTTWFDSTPCPHCLESGRNYPYGHHRYDTTSVCPICLGGRVIYIKRGNK